MSIEKVRLYLRQWNKDKDIIEIAESTATVIDAAKALKVIPARIAKTISLYKNDSVIVIVAAGDMKLDNQKYKSYFGVKTKMIPPAEVFEKTGYLIGGVCPFALPVGTNVYLDISLKRFETVFPACGNANSAIELTLGELNLYSKNKDWVDVCKPISE